MRVRGSVAPDDALGPVAVGAPEARIDRGGCVNTLAPTRWQTEKTSASAANSCLIEIERWTGAAAAPAASLGEEEEP